MDVDDDAMLIKDCETNRKMNDVVLTLTREEASELCDYLLMLQARPELKRVHLSEIVGTQLVREITVVLDNKMAVV